MAEYTRELFLQALDEWARYPQAFKSLAPEEQSEFLESQGYDSLRDLLAHVSVWWEEARGIINEAIKKSDAPPRKYDFAVFNAAAVKRFQDTPEANFLVWYESERLRIRKLVTSLSETQLHLPRVERWLDGVLLDHLKEHCVEASRFLVVDTLQREWGDYVEEYRALTGERQQAFLSKQGYARFADLLAHIIAWWEQGISVIESASPDDPCEVEDVDAFNASAVERYRALDEPAVQSQYENTRLTLANLVDMLPGEILGRSNVNTWLRADVLEHYFEHAI